MVTIKNYKKTFFIFLAAIAIILTMGLAQFWVVNQQAIVVSPNNKAPAPVLTDIIEGFAPHKALYDIKMISNKSGSQIVNVEGEMFFEWLPACDAWITDHRFNLYYDYTDSPRVHAVSDFSAYETFDGAHFDFNSIKKRSGTIYSEIRGQANINQAHINKDQTHDIDIPSKATYSKPKDLEHVLDKNTFFPISHSLEMLTRAENGEKFFNAYLFDGGDEDGPAEVNSIVLGTVNALAHITPNEKINLELIKSKAYNIHLAFFETNKYAQTPEYEIEMIMHKNGIISDMIVNYPDFSVSQKLIALEKINPLNCE